ncbi:MAG: DUF1080 domain-containing protein [Bacteroidota bacterium]
MCKQTKKSTNEQSQDQLVVNETKSEWKVLFDGKTTSGWRNYGKKTISGWKVIDGILHNSGSGSDHGGDIVTIDEYEDFEIYFEWKIAKESNSGVFFHVNESAGAAIYYSGPEYQLLDDVGWPSKLKGAQYSGANYDMNGPINAKVKPLNEFNASRIIVKDTHVEHWLNDVKVVEYELWSDEWKKNVQSSKWKDHPKYGIFKKGSIGLQDHGGLTMFRNIKIKDLTDYGKSIFNGKNLDGWKIHGTEKWYVENGELICESGPDKKYGYLATTNKYKDFILRLKFKQEADGNSGVFFRSSIEGTKIAGWQVEVAPKDHDTGGIYESYGRGWLYKIPENKENILKENEWNDMTIKVQGNRVMVWLNNELMTDLKDDKIGEANGVVALQIHDGGGIKVRWKDIFIKEL